MPLSFTSMITFCLLYRRLISIFPCDGVYLHALESKLSSNISIRCLSAMAYTSWSGNEICKCNCFLSHSAWKLAHSSTSSSLRFTGSSVIDFLCVSTFSNSSSCVMRVWSLRVLLRAISSSWCASTDSSCCFPKSSSGAIISVTGVLMSWAVSMKNLILSSSYCFWSWLLLKRRIK